ncbi:purple acid phosphatase family protein [Cellulosimicrobium marinum]|uniref:purple acid phosphatase family protein n=1 Tax=Cellulosimicrobium marinum TaxID=1638992 RepID=UPI001E46F04A|nr:metallophosphoesterase family protein [Cellulosimicrobium marinum]MCB7136058.1 metallophosphoesterase family protein [Cellulosimicrobium marinum]
MNLPASRRSGVPARATASTLTAALVGSLLVAASTATATTATATTATAADRADESLLSTSGTTWRYLEDNTDPAGDDPDPRVWTTTAYDDSAWKTGTGAFGAKRGQPTGIGAAFPVTTLLTQYLPGTTTDVPTFFFRTDVDLTAAQLDDVPAFEGEIVYDDAAIVYVNGEEVVRLGDDDREITQNLQYHGNSRTDPVTGTFVVPADAFRAGENTISVALYQDAPTSSDIYLDVRSLVPTHGEVRDVALNVGADETQANVAWFSTLPGAGEVQWVGPDARTAEGEIDWSAAESASATSGTAADGATYHHATLTDLEEHTAYTYRVGGAATGWSEPATFDTGTFADEFSFLFIGDAQIGASGNATNDAARWAENLGTMTARHPDASLLLSAGDQVEHAGSAEQYTGFLAPRQMRELRFATQDGNHDTASALYDQHFAMPNLSAEQRRDYWYGYNDMLVVGIDSNDWSEADVAGHEAFLRDVIGTHGDDYSWVLVTFHHSLYSQAFHSRDRDVVALREALSPVFSELGVDLVLAGHDHIYTRSHLMEGTTPVDPAATPAVGDVLVPEGDQVLYVTGNSASGSKYYGFDGEKPWTAWWEQERTPSYSDVDVTPEALTITTYETATERVMDRVTLSRAPQGPELTQVTAESRCLAGRAYVAVRATNGEDVPVDVTLATPFGTRTVADLAPGKAAYQSFATRATSVEAGTVTVTGALPDGGASRTVDVPVAALTCG